jgi:erythronate-4-phosphate dehydrogenase
MLILADENIPCVREAFASLGEVRTLPGRAMTAESMREAEVLLVRSVTQVGPRLLEGSRVRFVATATIGFDHVDLDYLAARGIGFAAAPGSNAESVAEYVATALLLLESRGKLRLADSTLGIVGVGNVGSRVARIAEALGMRVLLDDPPRARAEGTASFVSLESICAQADVITLHVPLSHEGPDATWHLLDQAFLASIRPGTILFNTSRGSVHETGALKAARRAGRIGSLVLDVFEAEPAIDPEMVALAEFATPHIAGYSFDGKVAGTRMIFEAACRFFGRPARWPEGVPPGEDPICRLDRPEPLVAVRAAYDLLADDASLRQVMQASAAEERARGFDRLRKEYPRRREFARWTIELDGPALSVGPYLASLGFRVTPDAASTARPAGRTPK